MTADGQALQVSATENADLFWAIRGGGGNFGIVTSFEFRLVPVSTVYGGLLAFPFPQAEVVLRAYRDFIASAPDDLTTVAVLMTGPDGNKLAGVGVAYLGSQEDGERVLRPLTELGPVMSTMAMVPYGAALEAMDAMAPQGIAHRWRSGFLRGLSDEAIATLASRYANAPTPFGEVLVEHYGGEMGRVASDAMAFPHRTEEINLVLSTGWVTPESEAPAKQWIDEFFAAMQPHLSGSVYVGFLDNEGPERVKAAYGANYARLVELKKRYDPANLFRMNQNIVPE